MLMGTMKGGDGRRNGVRQRQDCAAGHNLNNTALRIIPPLLDTELDTEVALFDICQIIIGTIFYQYQYFAKFPYRNRYFQECPY